MATFTNQATLSYGENTINSNITVGEIVYDISISKSTTASCYSFGDEITFVVSVVNNSSESSACLSVTDDLGGYTFDYTTLIPLSYIDGSVLYYINGVLQASPTVTLTDVVTFDNLSLSADASAMLIYSVKVNEFAPLESASTITATSTAVDCTSALEVSADVSISVCEVADLLISKCLSPTTVSENEVITYTFTIQNTGNVDADAALGAILTDTFLPILSDISVYNDGTAWTSGVEYSYDTLTGEFATNAGYIIVDAAQFTQNTITGDWEVTPSYTVITVSGTV